MHHTHFVALSMLGPRGSRFAACLPMMGAAGTSPAVDCVRGAIGPRGVPLGRVPGESVSGE